MSRQWIDGIVYAGTTGTAITSASGTSGIPLPSIRMSYVELQPRRKVYKFQRGFRTDDVVDVNAGMPGALITLHPRDDTFSDVLGEVARLLSGTVTAIRSDGGSGDKPGRIASGFQLMVRPITGATGRVLYTPRAVPQFDVSLYWGRDKPPTDEMELTFMASRSANQTHQAFMVGTVSEINGVFFP